MRDEYTDIGSRRRDTLLSNKTTSLDGAERSLIGGGVYIYHPSLSGSEQPLETNQLLAEVGDDTDRRNNEVIF